MPFRDKRAGLLYLLIATNAKSMNCIQGAQVYGWLSSNSGSESRSIFS